MAFGFPAYHTEQVSPGARSAADLRAAVKAALSALSWAIQSESSARIEASASINLQSWGEKILIDFLPTGGLTVTSKCVLPTQCFDWGKNRGNIEKLLAALDQRAG